MLVVRRTQMGFWLSMIINVWSTPRTGSVWYSFYQQSLYPDSVHLDELFNRYHMDMYRFMENGIRLNLRNYKDGAYYPEYFVDNGVITGKAVYQERSRSINEEEQYRIELFNQCSPDKVMIVHNHVAPMSENVRDKLIEMGDKNYFLYRKDKRAQLGSYVIASSTKQFVQFTEGVQTGIVEDIQPELLRDMIRRIKIWDSIAKNVSDSKSEIIAYEDIEFEDREKFPKKQNVDYKNRLSNNMLNLIDELIREYENDRN